MPSKSPREMTLHHVAPTLPGLPASPSYDSYELCDPGHVIAYDSQFYICQVIALVFPNIVMEKKPQILTSVCTYSISAKQA